MSIHEPVAPTQRIYRQLLNAMSHPGRVYSLPLEGYWPNTWLAIAETLLDHEVCFAVVGKEDTQIVTQNIIAATKAQPVDVKEADYIVVMGSDSQGAIYQSKRGVPEYPDRSATFIYVLEGRQTFSVDGITLRGPGIPEPSSPEMNGIDRMELVSIRVVNKEYPLGIDCIFLDEEDHVMCIPRSTNIALES